VPEVLLGVLGLCLALLIIFLARYQLLTLRYVLGWIFVAAAIAASGALTGVAEPIADELGLRSEEFFLGVAFFLLLLIAVQLSITASGLTEMVRNVCESMALAEERIRQLEAESGGVASERPAAPGGSQAEGDRPE